MVQFYDNKKERYKERGKWTRTLYIVLVKPNHITLIYFHYRRHSFYLLHSSLFTSRLVCCTRRERSLALLVPVESQDNAGSVNDNNKWRRFKPHPSRYSCNSLLASYPNMAGLDVDPPPSTSPPPGCEFCWVHSRHVTLTHSHPPPHPTRCLCLKITTTSAAKNPRLQFYP